MLGIGNNSETTPLQVNGNKSNIDNGYLNVGGTATSTN